MKCIAKLSQALFFLSLTGLIVSCNEVDKLTQFDMKYDSQVTVKSSALLIDTPLSFATPEIQSNSQSTFESNNTRKDLVEKVYLKSTALEVSSPADGDFGFLKSIEVYLKADGLPKIKIAWKENIPAEIGNELILETSSENLKDYVVQDKFTLSVTTITDETINQDHDIDIRSVFHVDAKILGI